MKKLLTGAITALIMTTTSVLADITLVVPQAAGGGTTVWAEIVTKELERHLGERIVLRLIPGARDIPGVNAFHNDLRFDENTIVVTHGGNGVSFLQEEVDYNYADYDSIGLMNLNIIAGKRIDNDMSNPIFAAGSGQTPEAYAMTMLICGPDKTVDEYVDCFKENVTWVKGMSGGERRLAFIRGELNGTRENPAAYKKYVGPDENAEIWFHHGILQADGSHTDDPNYPGYQFEILFEQLWGVAPSGEFYDAYKLVKSFRDGLQKAIWINKGNPELRDRLVAAMIAMSADADSVAAIQAKVGNYDWIIGSAGDAHRDMLMSFITEPALRNLVKFNIAALGLNSIYKEELIK
tara:strand:- start:7068 stop:8117 length:1050 start_codon:yes stop_codon:yes gene_type:complete